jgi:type II secretory pathway component PulK
MMRTRRSHGFILLTALLMIAIVAVALVTMTTAAASRSRQQANDVQQAQLEQLLLAGAQDVVQRLNSGAGATDSKPIQVELPEALARIATLEVRIQPASIDASAKATIRATMNGKSASETISIAKTGSAWRISAAALD